MLAQVLGVAPDGAVSELLPWQLGARRRQPVRLPDLPLVAELRLELRQDPRDPPDVRQQPRVLLVRQLEVRGCPVEGPAGAAPG